MRRVILIIIIQTITLINKKENIAYFNPCQPITNIRIKRTPCHSRYDNVPCLVTSYKTVALNE